MHFSTTPLVRVGKSERGLPLASCSTYGRGSRQLKLRAPKGHAAMQYLHPMQRCMSIMTMPSSSRFQVAPVGHTLVQAGSVQWLHITSTGACRGRRPACAG